MKFIIPRPTSRSYKVLLKFFKHGPLTIKDLLSTSLTRFNFDSESAALQDVRRLVANGCLQEASDNRFEITPRASKFFGDIHPEQTAPRPIVPPRHVNNFTPEMRGYEASLRRQLRADA